MTRYIVTTSLLAQISKLMLFLHTTMLNLDPSTPFYWNISGPLPKISSMWLNLCGSILFLQMQNHQVKCPAHWCILAVDMPPLPYLLTNTSIVPPIESSLNLLGLTFTVTDSLINHDEIKGGVAVASSRKGKICLDSKMSCFLFCFGKSMVYLILLCNNRHLWLKPNWKQRLLRNL